MLNDEPEQIEGDMFTLTPVPLSRANYITAQFTNTSADVVAGQLNDYSVENAKLGYMLDQLKLVTTDNYYYTALVVMMKWDDAE